MNILSNCLLYIAIPCLTFAEIPLPPCTLLDLGIIPKPTSISTFHRQCPMSFRRIFRFRSWPQNVFIRRPKMISPHAVHNQPAVLYDLLDVLIPPAPIMIRVQLGPVVQNTVDKTEIRPTMLQQEDL